MSWFSFFSRRGPKDFPLEECAALTQAQPDTPASQAPEPPADAPKYDIIIIGAGTAGSVLANRLSADGTRTVLVLEKGTYMSDALSKIPLISAARAFQEFYTTMIKSVPQTGLGGKQHALQIGRMVGGSSAINATVYTRGAHCEFDSWECKGWSGAELDKYFVNSETCHAEPEHGRLAPSRGTSGPWHVRIPLPTLGFNAPLLTAMDRLGIARTVDPHAYKNGEGPVSTGSWTTQTSQKADGTRHHAGFAYLSEDVLRDRANLKLCIDAGVERVHLEREDGILRAKGVWVTQKGKVYYARSKHIIVSSGSIFSPCILQRSGLGPAPLLKSLSIPVLEDIPGVGSNLMDHVLVPLHFSIPLAHSAYSLAHGYRIVPTLISSIYTWLRTGRGMFSTPCLTESMSYFCSKHVETLPESEATAPGRIRLRCKNVRSQVTDIELSATGIHADTAMPHYYGLGPRGVLAFLCFLVKPKSTGTIQITSSKEADFPQVDPAYFQEQCDIEALRIGVRVALSVAARMRHELQYDIGPASVPGWNSEKGGWDEELLPAIESSEDAELSPEFSFVDPVKISDATIDIFIRKHAYGAQHMSSTCRMGNASAGAVVDPISLEVHGTKGLHVCDASIFPRVLSAHPTAAVIACAEKFADTQATSF
ncbi:hypothetical protein OC845_002268 [Tilletia horrida]|nr:hypothetical protein OC845_002268 [Tilletia horrida]